MKTCHVYPVSAGRTGYRWMWWCIDGEKKSTSGRAFELFYECVEDARAHGGTVDLARISREIAEQGGAGSGGLSTEYRP